MALGLTASTLAKEAHVATGSVENVIRRERAGRPLDRIGPAEVKIIAALDRLESAAAAAAAQRESDTLDVDWACALLSQIPVAARERILVEIAEEYVRSHSV